MGEELKIKGANNSISASKFGYIDWATLHLYGIDPEESFCLLAGSQFPNVDLEIIELSASGSLAATSGLITRLFRNLA